MEDKLPTRFEMIEAYNELYKKVERYEKALKFYADKENYEVTRNDLDPTVDYVHVIDMDEGDTARKALEG